jgi:hypothetical protein
MHLTALHLITNESKQANKQSNEINRLPYFFIPKYRKDLRCHFSFLGDDELYEIIPTS